MITLLTGLPGHGKGVYGLDWLVTKIEKENEKLAEEGKPLRQVFYNGINECKIPNWIHLEDPKKWSECPAGSYILLDECQNTFRIRSSSAAVPEWVSKLETHRHHGLDLLLITQHPMLIDGNVRRLVGQHFHIIRKFGKEKAVVHEWNSVNTQCDKVRKDSIRHDYSYNKKVYDYYKSAEVHTVKKNVPMRVYMLYIIPVLLAVIVYFTYDSLVNKYTPKALESSEASSQNTQNSRSGRISEAKTLSEYITERIPRIAVIPESAPLYDDITKPEIAPRVAACIDSKKQGCQCWTQQATKLVVEESFCRQVVKYGIFRDYQIASNDYRANNNGGIGGATPDGDYKRPQARWIDNSRARLSAP